MQSRNTVYVAFMKEDIDSLLASLDLSNSHNYVNAFITLAEDQNESEMYSMAEGYSEKLEKHPLHKLDALKETVCPILPLLQRTNGHLYEGHCNIEQMQPKHKYKYWTCFKRFMWMTAPLFPICSQKQKPNMTSVRHSSIKSNMLWGFNCRAAACALEQDKERVAITGTRSFPIILC